MLRKTSVIAILALLIASLFAGSVTSAGADSQAESGQAGTAAAGTGIVTLSHGPPLIMAFVGLMSDGFTSKRPVADYFDHDNRTSVTMSYPMAGAAMTVAGPDSGASCVTGAGTVSSMTGTDSGVYTSDVPGTGMSIVIYTNESYVERRAPSFSFMTIYGGDNDTGFSTLRRMTLPDDMVIHNRASLYRQGNITPENYDLTWTERNVTAAGPIGYFDTHLEIPEENWSSDVNWPQMPFPDAMPPGLVEFNGSMAVDMVTLRALVDNATAGTAFAGSAAVGNDSAGSTAMADPYNDDIAAGQTDWHSVDISSAVQSFNVDLKWNDTADNLRLEIYTPDGKVLGPYYDSSDGKIDGRIDLNIANPSSGGVATGEYYLKVTDTSPTGKDEYYVKTY